MTKLVLIVVGNDCFVNILEKIKQNSSFQFQIKKVLSLDSIKWNNDMGYVPFILFFDMDYLKNESQAVIDFMKLHHKAKRFVLLKDYFFNNEIRHFFKSGAFDCLQKPVDTESVYHLIHEAIKSVQEHSNSGQNQQRMKHYQSSEKVSLAYDLIFGNVKHAKNIWERSQLAGLSRVPNIAMVICIDDFYRLMKNKSKLWEQSVRNEVIEAVRKYFLSEKVRETIVIITGPEKIVVLLSLPVENNVQTYKQSSIKYSQQIKKYMNKMIGHTVTIGIGNYYEDARNLHLSYQEALHAQSYKFFTGNDAIIHIDDVKPFTNEIGFLPNEEILIMANKLTIGDVEGVKAHVEVILQIVFSQTNMNPKSFRLVMLDFLSILSRSAISGGAKPSEMIAIQLEYAKELFLLENVEQVRQWFYEVIHDLLEQSLTNHNEQVLKSVQKALQYINTHFTEDVTLERVAQYVHLSPNYFSHIFKKTTGSSFIEYLTYLRIDKAKSMLMDLNYTIYQIAGAVGYQTPRYFTRVFKSINGMTPSTYRNSMLVTNVTNKSKSS